MINKFITVGSKQLISVWQATNLGLLFAVILVSGFLSKAYVFVLLLFFAVLVITLLRHTNPQFLTKRKLLLVVWAMWIGWAVFTTITSTVFPRSLVALAFQLLLPLVWLVGAAHGYVSHQGIALQRIQRTLFSVGMLALPLSLLIGVDQWIPFLPAEIKRINILRFYDHARLSGLLVGLLPFVFNGINGVQFTRNSYRRVWLLACYLGVFMLIILTNSRFLISVAVFQVIFLQFENIKKVLAISVRLRMLMNKFKYWFAVLSLSVSSVIVGVLLVTSCLTLFQETAIGRVCRPTSSTARVNYWFQATRQFVHSPVLGSGLGTFSLSSLKWQSGPREFSAFAHNIMLEALSESGIVGGLLSATLLYLLFVTSWKELSKSITGLQSDEHRDSQFSTTSALNLAVCCMILNSLLDFTYNESFVWPIAVSLSGLSVGIADSGNSPTDKSRLVRIISKSLSGFALVLASLYFLSGIYRLTGGGKILQASYFAFQNRMQTQIFQTSLLNNDLITNWYWSDPSFLQSSIAFQSNTSVLVKRLLMLDPWSALNYFECRKDMSNYLQPDDQRKLRITLAEKITSKPESARVNISFDLKDELRKCLLLDTNYYLNSDEADLALHAMQLAIHLDKVSLQSYSLLQSINSATPDSKLKLLIALLEFPESAFDQRRTMLGEMLLSLLQRQSNQLNLVDWRKLSEYLLKIEPSMAQNLLNAMVSTLVESQDNLYQVDANTLDKIWILLEIIIKYDNTLVGYSVTEQLADAYIFAGDKLILTNPSEGAISYRRAKDLSPWILEKRKHALSKTDWSSFPVETLRLYLDTVYTEKNIKGQVWNEKVRLLQYLADHAVHAGDQRRAIEYLDRLRQSSPDDYWVQIQLANYYLLQHEAENARKALGECLQRMPNHTNCQLQLYALNTDSFINTYWRASEKILSQ